MLDGIIFDSDKYKIVLENGIVIGNLQRSALTFLYEGKLDKSIFTRNMKEIQVIRIPSEETLKQRAAEEKEFTDQNPDIEFEPYYDDNETMFDQVVVNYEYYEEENKTMFCINASNVSEIEQLKKQLEYLSMMTNVDL